MNTGKTLTIAQQLDVAANLAVGKVYDVDLGKPRICISSSQVDRVKPGIDFLSSKVIRAFIDFPDAVYDTADQKVDAACSLGIARLHIYLVECGHDKKTYKNDFLRVMNSACAAVDAVNWYWFTGSQDEAKLFADGVLKINNKAAGHMANGYTAEARAAVGLA